MKRIRKGNNIEIVWLLYENDGNVHNLEGKSLELYMTCGGYKYPVTDYTVTENAIAWTFPAAVQTKTGYYQLVLIERDEAMGLKSYDVKEAFCLEPKDALTNIFTIANKDCKVIVKSVLSYAHITNLASIDQVEAEDGNGTIVTFNLTNGKSFTIPFVPGSGSGGGEYILKPATAVKLGGLKVGFTQTGNKYPVRLNEQSNAFVEVPDSLGVNVHDGLYSTSSKDALSANMGRILREMIESLPSGGGEGGGVTSSKYALYLDEDGPEFIRRQGSNITLIKFKSSSYYWDRIPKNGDFAMCFDGSGRVACFELIVREDEEEGLIIVSNSTLKAFSLLVADLEGGGGGGGEKGDPGDPGRSIVSVQNWYKLCADESVQATPMNIEDPSSAAGGSWSLTAGSPTAQYPYLRCFMQVNYDTPLANGYTYTRSSAFTARYFNSDSSQDYSDLVEALASLRADLDADLVNYDSQISALNAALEALRSSISGSITNQLNSLRDRLDRIDASDVAEIRDGAEGLWTVLTSYTDDTNGQKSFSDIALNAKNAKAMLQTGSTFFDRTVGGEITLDGILGRIAARVTRQDVSAMIASAQFSVDPASLNSVISKSQACWKKGGVLFPYDLYLTDYMTANPSGTLAGYETYMTSAYADGGPEGDGTDEHPDGPFELVVVVEQFSAIKQTMDEISASVDTTKYMWKNIGTVTAERPPFVSYNAFETQWENRSATYSEYTYEQYVHNVLLYERVEVGSALSSITQTSDEIKAQLGDMGYFWKKGNEYQRYAVPSNKTRDEYVTEMQTAGWTLITYASRMSVIDAFPDSITALVKNSTLVWFNNSTTDIKPYDEWLDDYELTDKSVSYEEYVPLNHTGYVLTVVTDSFSRIKQTAQEISSAVERIDGAEEQLSSISQTADEISLAVSKMHKCWKDNATGELYEYFDEDFVAGYETYKESTQNPLDYEDWVENTKNCTLSSSFEEVSGIKLQGDKIWAGIGDGDDVKASIEILADAETDEGKIVLDADNVIINGGLQAGVVKAGAIDAGAVTTEKLDAGAVTAGKIDTGAVTAEKIYSGAVTTNKLDAYAVTAAKIEAGAITADKIATGVLEAAFASILEQLTVGENSNIVLEDGLIKFYDSNDHLRMQLGQGEDDDTPVLKFFDADGETELYDLGPNGLMQRNSTFAAPHFNAVRFWHFNSISEGNKIVAITQASAQHDYGQNAIYSDTPLFWYKYADAMKVIWLTEVQSVIQYQDPDTGDYSASNSKYNNKHFLNGDFTYNAPDGYYVIDAVLWEGASATNKRATALRIVTENNVKKYYYGHIDLTNVDQNAGISGTVDEIKINTLFE